MNKRARLSPSQSAILAVQELLDKCGGRGVLVGAIALGALVEPRATADVDAMLLADLDDLPLILAEAAKLGMSSRSTDPERLAQETRMVLLRHEPTGTDVDLALGLLPFEEEVVARAIRLSAGSASISVPTVEDLVILKAVANRPQDRVDIQKIVETFPDLDRSRVEDWVRQFGEVLETPQLWSEIEPLLNPE